MADASPPVTHASASGPAKTRLQKLMRCRVCWEYRPLEAFYSLSISKHDDRFRGGCNKCADVPYEQWYEVIHLAELSAGTKGIEYTIDEKEVELDDAAFVAMGGVLRPPGPPPATHRCYACWRPCAYGELVGECSCTHPEDEVKFRGLCAPCHKVPYDQWHAPRPDLYEHVLQRTGLKGRIQPG